MKIESVLKINKYEHVLSIENKSKYTIQIGLVPTKPKRKVFLYMIIHPNEFIAKYFGEGVDFDISDLYFRFVEN